MSAEDFKRYVGIIPPSGAIGAVCPECAKPSRIADFLVERAGCEVCGAYDGIACPHCEFLADGVHKKWFPVVFVGDEAEFPDLPLDD